MKSFLSAILRLLLLGGALLLLALACNMLSNNGDLPDLSGLPDLPGLADIPELLGMPTGQVTVSVGDLPAPQGEGGAVATPAPGGGQALPVLPLETAMIATPTPSLPGNGRLLMIGLDERLWSVPPDGGQPVALGVASELYLAPVNAWYSADGRFALAARPEGDALSVWAVPVDGSSQGVRLGEWPQDWSSGQRRAFYDFSADGRRALYVELIGESATLQVYDLYSGEQATLVLPYDPQALSLAAFIGVGGQILVRGYDSASQGDTLEIYTLPNLAPGTAQRIAGVPGRRIRQFMTSPDGAKVAVVLQDRLQEGGLERLWVIDLTQGKAQAVLEDEGSSLLVYPAWSEDGRWLLFNHWVGQEKLRYSYRAFDTQAAQSYPIVADLESSTPGQPLSRVISFAPDNEALAFTLYEAQPDTLSSWIAVFDGSYTKKLAEATQSGERSSGEYAAGISPDWTHSLIVVADETGRTGSLYAALLDGSQRELLDQWIPYRFFEFGPVVSPDGLSVAYMRLDLASERAELCRIGWDGKGQKVLLAGSQQEVNAGAPVGIPLRWLRLP